MRRLTYLCTPSGFESNESIEKNSILFESNHERGYQIPKQSEEVSKSPVSNPVGYLKVNLIDLIELVEEEDWSSGITTIKLEVKNKLNLDTIIL